MQFLKKTKMSETAELLLLMRMKSSKASVESDIVYNSKRKADTMIWVFLLFL